MVHNGIEYADMQLIAESYELLRHGDGLEVPEIAERFRSWNEGELESFLIEISARVLSKTDEATGKPLVDVILDAAEQKGTGRWTAQNALELGVPLTGITEAVFARTLSALKDQRVAAADRLAGPSRSGTGGAAAGRRSGAGPVRLEDRLLRAGLRADGRRLRRRGLERRPRFDGHDLAGWLHHSRPLPGPHSRGLRRGPEAGQPDAGRLLRQALEEAQDPWRRVVARAAELGIPTPAFSSSLAYYDGYRRARGPASLIQGLRDLFGAHTYQRVDREGKFHIQWGGDGREVEA